MENQAPINPPTRKLLLPPNTTLFPVPVVLITCGTGKRANLFTVNRIASCNAEPPMLSISIRPSRASHALIEEFGEFAVHLPWPDQDLITDYVGMTTQRSTDKWVDTCLTRQKATEIHSPLIAECPVSLECRVVQQVRLPSHSLFIGEVLHLHADPAVINDQGEVDFELARGGLPYRSAVVRERPVENKRPGDLLKEINA